LKIGVIGAGTMGRLIINSIMFTLGWVENNNIHVSTRRPELLQKYEDFGINIYFDNERLIKTCDIIIFSFPPSLDNWVALNLKESLKERCLNT